MGDDPKSAAPPIDGPWISVHTFCAASEPEPGTENGFYGMRSLRFSREEARRVWASLGTILTDEERSR